MTGTDENAALGKLETNVATMSEQMGRLITTVDRMAEKMERLTVLEERHSSTNAALDRAFTAIATVKTDVATFQSDMRAKHSGYDRIMWTAVGFCTAISLVWGVVAYQLNMGMNEGRDRQMRFEAHLNEDKITSEASVREAVNGR